MITAVVGYALDDGTIVRFEIEPSAGFQPEGNFDITLTWTPKPAAAS